jgi:hypothetical protein
MKENNRFINVSSLLLIPYEEAQQYHTILTFHKTILKSNPFEHEKRQNKLN